MSKQIKEMSFEEALYELEQIVKRIDSGTETLDFSVASFERGTSLRQHCVSKLEEAKLKIEKIVQEDGVSKKIDITDTL